MRQVRKGRKFATKAVALFLVLVMALAFPIMAQAADDGTTNQAEERPILLTLAPFVSHSGPVWERTRITDAIVAHIYQYENGPLVGTVVNNNGVGEFLSTSTFQQPNGWLLVFVEADGFQLPEPIELVFRPFDDTPFGGELVWFANIEQYFDKLPAGLESTPLDLTTASSWAEEGITRAVEYNLVPTTLQGDFGQATTRAEFAALAVALYENVNDEITGRTTFADTDDVNVQKMAYLGVVTGVGNNNFNPDGTITREQAAVLLARLAEAIGQPFPTATPTFADNADIASWAVDGVGAAQAAEVVGGVGDNSFNPQGTFTREQSIITMVRMFDLMN